MSQFDIDIQDASTSSEQYVMIGAASVSGLVDYLHARTPRHVAVPRTEAFYWSAKWQTDEAETRRNLDAGTYVEFDSDDPDDVIRWLLSPDD